MMNLVTALLLGAASVPAIGSVAVLVRPVEKGETLSATDFEMVAPSPAARSGMAPADAAGKEAARRLRQGAAIQVGDLVAPRLVRRGEMVTISFASGPLLITSSGRALSDAGKGESLRVLSLSTNRTLEVVADKPGHVLLPN